MPAVAIRALIPALALSLFSSFALAEEVKTSTELTALTLYDSGQAYDVMRAPDGVVLNDLTLIENDGPGAGLSEKGVHFEPLHAGVQIRKVLRLDDTRARSAHVVVYMEPQAPQNTPPWYLVVNGHRVEGVPQSWHERVWWWVPVPVEFLVQGDNEIRVACDAPEGQGYKVLFARSDEYERGGGAFSLKGHTGLLTSGFVERPDSGVLEGLTPIEVGESSDRSLDGGQSWVPGLLGPQADTPGEYVIRLNLNQTQPTGSLVSPPIDLWTEEHGIASRSTATQLHLSGSGDTPEGTSIAWAVRFADTPDPTDASWGDFQTVAEGANADAGLADTAQRFMQVRVTLNSTSPLATPIFHGLRIERVLQQSPPLKKTFYARNVVNPNLLYPSHTMHFENTGALQFAELRNNLPESLLIRKTQGQFAEINQIRHYVSQLWYHGSPHPEYPEWNAVDILKRKLQYGHGGMCIQFTIVFIQSLQALGYQARHVNVFNHETAEVYIDELEKWVVVDPESVFDSYEFNTDTGEPISVKEQHEYFLKRYGFTAENPIPWASPEPWNNWSNSGRTETPQPLEISTFTDWINNPDPARKPPQHNLAGFFRLIPRNDFLTRPTPRPVSQGSTHWPWSGYLCWYDAATPRKLQYALHSDREADFYPTINRVHFTATHGATPGTVDIRMTSQTPNFETYEINLNGAGWSPSPADFTWTLQPAGLNRLQMRTKNAFGMEGAPSQIEVFYHYREPYKPKEVK
ncbi:MAG: transglutaminase domain-containing protein [Candidatus Hydrogenedentes bacterium]|nr:transglutaminase domain-containing protein [Candidatus Hydrogenedentota bacterium]